MVDERVGGVDEHDRRAVDPAKRRLERVRERDPSRLPAQRERGERLVGVGERIDARTRRAPERVARRLAPARVGFGARGRGRRRRRRRTRAGRWRPRLDDVVGEHGVHHGRVRRSNGPTIMRWISMVPDATVAACA